MQFEHKWYAVVNGCYPGTGRGRCRAHSCGPLSFEPRSRSVELGASPLTIPSLSDWDGPTTTFRWCQQTSTSWRWPEATHQASQIEIPTWNLDSEIFPTLLSDMGHHRPLRPLGNDKVAGGRWLSLHGRPLSPHSLSSLSILHRFLFFSFFLNISGDTKNWKNKNKIFTLSVHLKLCKSAQPILTCGEFRFVHIFNPYLRESRWRHCTLQGLSPMIL